MNNGLLQGRGREETSETRCLSMLRLKVLHRSTTAGPGAMMIIQGLYGVNISVKNIFKTGSGLHRAKDPPFGNGYTPFNYTSRDGGRQTGGLLRGAR